MKLKWNIYLIYIYIYIYIYVSFIINEYEFRSRIIKKELAKGPNRILLLPEDLEFIQTANSNMLSKVISFYEN